MLNLHETAARIQSAQLAPSELLAQTFAKINEYKDINAVVSLNEAYAIKQAQLADKEVLNNYRGLLHGVPITIKDAFATEHIPTSYGTPFRFRNQKNANVVDRLRAQGAIIIGKSNLPTVSFDWQSRHPRYGHTLHPFDARNSPGGSSGGAAAAVAAGIVPVEVGSDIAGSLRVPAGLCGVNTIRPTEGLISLQGHMSIPFTRPLKSLLTAGPIARNLKDLEYVFKCLVDVEPPNLFPVLKRVAIRTNFPDGVISDSVRQVYSRAIDIFRQQGLEVVLDPEGINYQEALTLWGNICGYEMSTVSPIYYPRSLKLLYRRFFYSIFGRHLITRALGDGMAMGRKAYRNALARRAEMMEEFLHHQKDYDLLVTPVCGIEELPLSKTGSAFHVDGNRARYADPFAILNAATAIFGHPVVVINGGYGQHHMPVGLQLHGRRYEDFVLLSHARTLEKMLADANVEDTRAAG